MWQPGAHRPYRARAKGLRRRERLRPKRSRGMASTRGLTPLRQGRVHGVVVVYTRPNMARLSRLEKLFSAVAAHDGSRARTTALAIADDEEVLKHIPAAQRLRAALTLVNGTAKTVDPNGHSFLSEDALTPVAVAAGLGQLVLPKVTQRELTLLPEEWIRRDRLAAVGVRRRSRVLL
jgi:hypothetical protein